MRYDRDGFVRAVYERLARADTADGRVDAGVVYGPEADAELRGLLRTADTATDMEARHAAGWLCAARAMADPGQHGSVQGCMAGTLLFPVWVLEPDSVPPLLAAGYAAADPALRPDPSAADGPFEWWAQSEASLIAAQGRAHDVPPGAPEDQRRLHELAALLLAVTPSREVRLATAVGSGSLAVLATAEYEPAYAQRRAALNRALEAAELPWPFADLPESSGTGDPAVLAHRALKGLPASSPAWLPTLAAVGERLLGRYTTSYDPEDLHDAVAVARDVVAQLPPGSPHAPRCLGALATALVMLRQREGGTPEECDETVEVCRRARHGHPEPAQAAYDLGSALLVRMQLTGRTEDLDEAIAVFNEGLAAAGSAGGRTGLNHALGNALRARSSVTGSAADLEAALVLTGPTTVSGPGAQTPLLTRAMALYARYTLDPQGHGADLDEALRLLRQAETLMPPGHPDRPTMLGDLGLALVASYQRSANLEELNEAVRRHREAVDLTPEGHEILGVRLLNLGTALGLRHQLTEDGDDLREAQDCRRRAAGLPGMGRAHQAALLSSRAISLVMGAGRAADPPAVLDEAVDLFRQAIATTPEGDWRLYRRRQGLAVALLVRFGLTLRGGDLREVRELADSVVAELDARSPDLPSALMVAAGARLADPLSLLSAAARKDAVALLRRAVEATPPGDGRRTSRLISLGRALSDRGLGRRRRPADLAQAADVFRTAALEEGCAPSQRLEAARAWAGTRAELGDWQGALDGYVVAVDLLPVVAPRHLVRDDQEFLLSRTGGLGADAAACAMRCGRPGLAVGLVERARGVILSHAFDADSDLTRLREAAPHLAARFEELRAALDTVTDTREFLPEEEAAGPGARADLRQRLAADWQEVTDRIRAEHPELGLLRPVRDWQERELQAVAADGPVVLIDVSAHGSHALLITHTSVDAVPLPGLDPATTAARRRTFEDALVRLDTPGISRKQSLRAQQDVRQTLGWLWQTVTGPVLDRLPAATRVWWSPGGQLGTLPLHAAQPDGAPGALDRIVSSYTPTLRALHHARIRLARPAGRGTLVVTVAQAAGRPPLPGAHSEAEHLARTLPGVTLLADARATHSAVVTTLHRNAHVHFACHALGDPQRPSGSRLVLHDHHQHPLTVRDLARLRLPSVRLAYLSACDTLRTSPELADEAVHLVSAFQIAGFPHVVGSLWHVDDVIGAEVAQAVYTALHAGDGTLDVTRTAQALHQAVRTLRDTYPRTPSLWACQIHAGP